MLTKFNNLFCYCGEALRGPAMVVIANSLAIGYERVHTMTIRQTL
jgi:hypothetical protein